MASSLPPTMKALVVPKPGSPIELRTIPTPTPVHGSVVIRVLATHLGDKNEEVFTGTHKFLTFPNDLIPGGHAIGRIAATGPDTTSLTPGQLVMIHSFVRARDDPNDVQILWGLYEGPTPTTKKFYKDNYLAGTFAEYVRAPLENVEPLNEKKLLSPVTEGGLGYSVESLLKLITDLVPFGGFRGISLQPGERVIVAPATGQFSGAAVQVAVAMGAQVIAVGRSIEKLKKVQDICPPGRVQIVAITGDEKADTEALTQWGPVDAYMDISPAQASGPKNHVRACFNAVRNYGRVSLMGVLFDDIAIGYGAAVWKNLTIRGQYMYEREDVKIVVKMAEAGVLKVGKEDGVEVVGKFKLEDIASAFVAARENNGVGKIVALTP